MSDSRLTLLGIAVMLSLTSINSTWAGDVKLVKQPSSFPLMITFPGSYRLKGNITVPDENTTAVMITAEHVTLDLNGYSIRGPVECTGIPIGGCTVTGTGKGIVSTVRFTRISNGTVRGLGGTGIDVSGSAYQRVERMTVTSNGGHGILLDVMAEAFDNAVLQNNGVGIQVEALSNVRGNLIAGNAGVGLNTGVAKTAYSGNVIGSNGGGTVGGNGVSSGNNACDGSPTCP